MRPELDGFVNNVAREVAGAHLVIPWRAAIGRYACPLMVVERSSAPAAGAGTDEAPPRPRRSWPAPTRLALLCGLLYLPFVFFGYGTDIDITNVRRAGESLFEGEYRYSRAPGAFAYETVTGLLDRLGGSIAVNLGSVVAAVVTLVALAHIVDRRQGPRSARIAVVVVASQPWFWVAATSLGDYLYAAAFLLLGIDACQRDRRLLAALAFGTGVGFRVGTVLLVAAYLLAEVTGDDALRETHPTPVERWRTAIQTGLLTVAVGALWFIPPWLSVGRTTQFLQNQFRVGSIPVQIARWGIKNVAFLGVITIIVLVVRSPVLVDSLRRFRSLVMVRFAVFAAVTTEILYLRFPWKPVHLLPLILSIALLFAASSKASNRLVIAVVGSHLALALFSFTLAAPDVADAANGGELDLGLTWGVVVNELDCRVNTVDDFPDVEGEWPELDSADADFAAVAVFACQARSWRAGRGPSVLDGGP